MFDKLRRGDIQAIGAKSESGFAANLQPFTQGKPGQKGRQLLPLIFQEPGQATEGHFAMLARGITRPVLPDHGTVTLNLTRIVSDPENGGIICFRPDLAQAPKKTFYQLGESGVLA